MTPSERLHHYRIMGLTLLFAIGINCLDQYIR